MMAIHSPCIKYHYGILAFLSGLVLLTPCIGSSGTWTSKTPIPTKRYMFVSETVSGKIYVIGGYDGAYYATNEEYDPVADSWSTKTPMSQAREGSASGVVDDKIYVIGGNGSGVHYRNVEEYDPAANSWSSKTPIPVYFEQGAGAAVNGKVYAIGGFDGTQVLNTVWEYDPVADSWIEKNPMPTARNYIQASVVDGKIYVIGGADGTQALSTVEAYDPVADTWMTKAAMPVARHSGLNIAANGKIYYIGGSTFSTEVLEYDPASDTWTNCDGTCNPMPTGRVYLNGSVAGGKVYAISGQIEGGGYTMTNVVEEYTPPPGLVAYYPFNGNADDGSGSGNDGTVNGATLAEDRFGNANSAYSFDGVDDYILTSWGGNGEHNFQYPISVSLWVKDDYLGEEGAIDQLFSIYGTTNDYSAARFVAHSSPSEFQVNVKTENGHQSYINYPAGWYDDNIEDSNWHHLVVYSLGEVSAEVYVYLDGRDVTNAASTIVYDDDIQPTFSDDDFCIGANHQHGNPNYYFKGFIDDIRIYNYALSTTEIDTLYHEGGWDPGLVAHYPFNGNANDESGNGYDGTVYGATLAEDRFGRTDSAYEFDGNNDWITVTAGNGYLGQTFETFSITAWIYSDLQQASYVYRSASSDGDFHLGTPDNANTAITAKIDGSIRKAYSSYDLNSWQHIVGTWNGSLLIFHLNGSPVDTVNASGQLNPAPTLWGNSLGGNVDGTYSFNGRLDDIRIYDRVLSGAEIEALYHEGGWDAPVVWHVSTGGDDGNAGTATEPLRNIQTALNQAADNDTVKVAGGTYQEGLISQSKVVMLGGYDASFAETERNIFAHKTNIQGVSTTVFTDNHGCTVDGFDFDGNGACDLGLRLTNGSVLTHNIIRGATKLGASAVETNGGAVVVNNTIVGSSGPGLDIYSGSGTPVIKNNIIANNGFGINTIDYSAAVRTFNDVHENAFNYIGFDDNPGVGDITLNPFFVDGANDDFRLQETSPCIDRGDPDPQYNDPDGSRNDMGAYYYQQPVDEPPTIVSYSPAQNALNVEQYAAISIKFDMDMDVANFNTATFVVHGSQAGRLSGTYSYDSGDSTATFIPDSPFKVGEVVSVTLTTGVQSAAEEPLASPYIWSFTAEVLGGSGEFAAAVTFGVGDDPYSVTVADLDHDGDSDLATTNFNSDNVSVLLGDGSGSFASAANYSVGDMPYSITATDLDSDGNIDLAVANSNSNNVSVLLGDGSGDLGTAVNYSVGASPRSVTAVDLNGDGYPDLATANLNSDNVSILLNDGSGGFVTAVNYAVGSGPVPIISTDVNDDGKRDLIVANHYSDNISVLLGDGSGGFSTAVNYNVGSYPFSITAFDLNEDGHSDLAVGNSVDDNVSVLLGDGSGGFATAVNYDVGDSPASVTVADLDGDGDGDLAVANNNSDNVSVLLNDGLGSFAAATNYNVGDIPWSITAADLDGDGDNDLIVANRNSDNISVLLNTGGAPPAVVSSSPAQNALNVAQDAAISVYFDMDMDAASINAATFVVHGNQTGRLSGTYSYDSGDSTATFISDSPFKVGEQVSVTLTKGIQNAAGEALENPYTWSFTTEVTEGSGEFAAAVDYDAGTTPRSVVATDLDGDGSLDLVVANYASHTISVLLGNGDGTFTDQATYTTGEGPRSVIAADLDSDGNLDLVTANQQSNNTSVFLGSGDGTFSEHVTYAAGEGSYTVVTADLDGDGILDLAVANLISDSLSVLLGYGDGTFAAQYAYFVHSTGSYPNSVVASDLDGDGDLDLVAANFTANSVSVLLGDGDGTFTPHAVYATGDGPQSVRAADLDGDGDLDLATANYSSNNVSVLAGNGDGTFAPQATFAAGDIPGSVYAADLDGDGVLDLVTANVGSDNVSMLIGAGDGTYADQVIFATDVNPRSICAADLDDDGDLDLVTTNEISDNVSVLLNTGGSTTSTQYINGAGDVDFPGTDLSMNFTSQTGTDTIKVQAFPTAPDGTFPSDATLEGDRYWIITHSGSGDFSVNLTFNLGQGTFSADDQQRPAQLLLLQRDSGGTLPWEIESHGASATDSTVIFADLTGFSQFVIGRSTDIEGPIISSEFRRVAQPDDLIEVDAYVRDPSGISSVKLHYLEGGSLVFDQADMNAQNDTTYRAGVPVASTVIRGLAYFIVGTDSVGNVTVTDTTSVPIAFPAGTFTTSMLVTAFSEGFPFNKWRLISIPCDIADTSVTSIIQEVLGVPPSDETWKIFRYTGPGRGDYLPVGRFTSGQSYFLKQIVSEGIEQPVHFTLGAGQSVDLTGQSILLPSRRWSFISSPYPFLVTVAPDQGTFKGPYTYGEFGSRGQEGWSTGQVQTILRPWGGYIIYNNTDQDEILTIRPPGLAKAMLPKDNAEHIAGWLVKLTIEGERYFDAGNVIGRIAGASDGLDSYDSPEPPYLEGYVSLTAENPDWESELLRTSDIRSDNAVNGEWDLVLLTRNETGVIDLSVGMEGDLPPQIVLVDLLERVVYDLKNDPQPISISDYDENVPYRLKVLAGEQGFVEEATDEILAQLPEQLALAQNYPNPFNPATTIGYALPRPAKVSLKIYNLLGQEIATLVNDWRELGYYSIAWQGRDQAGQSVASGMYFVVLRVDERTLTRKMVLLR